PDRDRHLRVPRHERVMSEKPPSNKELRADIAELSQKLGVEVTPATSNAALLEQRDGLRAQLAALEAGDGGGDKGAATTPPSGSRRGTVGATEAPPRRGRAAPRPPPSRRLPPPPLPGSRWLRTGRCAPRAASSGRASASGTTTLAPRRSSGSRPRASSSTPDA